MTSKPQRVVFIDLDAETDDEENWEEETLVDSTGQSCDVLTSQDFPFGSLGSDVDLSVGTSDVDIEFDVFEEFLEELATTETMDDKASKECETIDENDVKLIENYLKSDENCNLWANLNFEPNIEDKL